jgi:hypothetical protein
MWEGPYVRHCGGEERQSLLDPAKKKPMAKEKPFGG